MKTVTVTTSSAESARHVCHDVGHIGCVSFLNAKPLIEGLDHLPNLVVKFDVPSRLLADLESGAVDIALCPVIDLQRSAVPLEVVPAGGIGCDGPTLTVRIYSRVPLDQITDIYVDTDSHTSICLMRVLLAELYNIKPRLIDYHAREQVAEHRVITQPNTMLLIGDKVVTSAPSDDEYPYQMDLGEAWKTLTGMPFVFAVWMARQGTSLGALPALLNEARHNNASRIDAIVAQHASPLGWPDDQATRYLGHWLKYAIGPRELEAMQLFFTMAMQHGVIEHLRDMKVQQICVPQKST